MASRGRGSRAKGAAFERFIAKQLTKDTGHLFQRGLGQSRTGGSEIADVYSEELKDILHIEVKRQKVCNIKAALRQATSDAPHKVKVVITKDDRGPILVTQYKDECPTFQEEVTVLKKTGKRISYKKLEKNRILVVNDETVTAHYEDWIKPFKEWLWKRQHR